MGFTDENALTYYTQIQNALVTTHLKKVSDEDELDYKQILLNSALSWRFLWHISLNIDIWEYNFPMHGINLCNTLYFRYYQIILNKYWKIVVGVLESWPLSRQTCLTTTIMPYAEIVGSIWILNQRPKLVRGKTDQKMQIKFLLCDQPHIIK